MQIGVERFKIGSADLSNLPLLQYIAECEKPVIVSNGLRSDEQLDEAVNLLSKNITDITIFHSHLCTLPSSKCAPEPNRNFRENRFTNWFIYHSGLIWPSIFALPAGRRSKVHLLGQTSIWTGHIIFD